MNPAVKRRVHVVVSDRKQLHCGLEDNVPFPEYYTAEVKNRYDYYPFGMLMEERKYAAPDCRYDLDTVFTTVLDEPFEEDTYDWFYLEDWNHPGIDGLGNMILDRERTPLLYPMSPGTEGKQYRVRFGIDLNGCDSVQVSGNLQDVTSETIYSSGDYTFYFTSNDDYTAVSFYIEDPCQVLIDYVIIEEMDISATVLCDTDSVAGYRYGFNNMPKDNELYGDNNAYDFGARIYDPRIGRWLSVDPLQHKYAPQSPYSFAANSVLVFKDINGQWIGRVNKAEDGTKSIVFVAEAGDDFVTLSIQLGISMDELENGFGGIPYNTGNMTTIPEGTEISLSGLQQVQAINSYLNKPDIGLTNCSNCALAVNGISQVNAWESKTVPGEFDKNSSNSVTAMKEAAEILPNQFENIPESESKIGDIVTYKHSKDYIANDSDVKGLFEFKKITPGSQEAEAIINEFYVKGTTEHYSIVLLKDRTGQNVKQVFEKSGTNAPRVSSYPPDGGHYTPAGQRGDSSAIYTK